LGFILPGTPLPAGYAWVFGTAVGLTFIVAVIVAYRTVPRKSERAAVLVEPKAIKGLRPSVSRTTLFLWAIVLLVKVRSLN
jgi:hypothetical protein